MPREHFLTTLPKNKIKNAQLQSHTPIEMLVTIKQSSQRKTLRNCGPLSLICAGCCSGWLVHSFCVVAFKWLKECEEETKKTTAKKARNAENANRHPGGLLRVIITCNKFIIQNVQDIDKQLLPKRNAERRLLCLFDCHSSTRYGGCT